MAKTKPIVKAATLDDEINSSIKALSDATGAASASIIKVMAEAKKLTTEIKRHVKKKSVLIKRNKTALAKLKKSSNAATNKAAATVTNALKETKVALDAARTNKTSASAELASLRLVQKRLKAYSKVMVTADKLLNAPKKKRRIVKKSK